MHDETAYLNREALLDQYEETLIRLAFLDMDRLEAEKLEDEIEKGVYDGETTKFEEMYERSFPRVMGAVEKADKRARHARRRGYSLPRGAQIAVCLLLILTLGGAGAVALVPEVRFQALKLLINIEKEYTELSMVADESAAFTVPAGWQGTYFMAYIPEGFELGGMEHLPPALDDIYYVNDQDEVLYFTEYWPGTESNVDTEDAKIESIVIHGNEGILANKGKNYKIIWAVEDRFFLVDYDGDREKAILIAESVRKIK